jgi:hypothetical protein
VATPRIGRGDSPRKERIPHHGCDLTKALHFAEHHGFLVENRRRTGEKFLRHPDSQRPVVFNGRRKDASKKVIQFIRKHVSLVTDPSKGFAP